MPEVKTKVKLRLPQLRILKVLSDGGSLPRETIRTKCGFKSTGTMSVALHGTGELKGLVDAGLVKEVMIDVHGDGSKERCLEITKAGLKRIAEVKKLPALRDAKAHTNKRYKDKADAQTKK